jgi:DeoR/GlpR family transcriptional regulator of sugar metabolism
VADSAKYGKTGFVSVLPIQSIYGIISDKALHEDAMGDIAEAGLRVMRV